MLSTLTIRIAAVPGGAMDAFIHPACVIDPTRATYHDLTIVELLEQDITHCDACGMRIVPINVQLAKDHHAR